MRKELEGDKKLVYSVGRMVCVGIWCVVFGVRVCDVICDDVHIQ